jgi:SAM-dependent methyltransferase
MTEPEYVLGTHDDELIRLGLQHRVWRAAAYHLWERAGFGPGQSLLDVGAGPGYATHDLADLVGPHGKILAIEISDRFVDHLRNQAIPNVTVLRADAQQLKLPKESIDGAYARWLFSFVNSPEKVIAGVAPALRQGGVFAIQEYVSYRGTRLGPPSATFERVIEAITVSWQRHGGDSEVGCRLPRLLEQAGLRIRELSPIARVARPGSAVWEWPTTFFRNFVPTLVGEGLLNDSDVRMFFEDWAARTRDPSGFLLAPIVLDIQAVKV